MLTAIFFFIFTVIFEQNYPNFVLYLISGMLPFLYFSKAVVASANSIVSYSSLIQQIACPRQVFAVTGIMSELYHLCFASLVLVPLYVYYGFMPGLKALAVIPNTIVLTLLIVGLGLFLAALNVFVRDTAIVMALVMRMWFYMTPIFYTTERLDSAPDTVQFLYYLNPLVTVLEVYRWALLKGEPFPSLLHLAILGGETVAALIVGLTYFHWKENAMVKLL